MKYLDKYLNNPITKQGAIGAGGISLGASLLLMSGMPDIASGVAGVLMILAGVFISHHKTVPGLITIAIGAAAIIPILPIPLPTVKNLIHEGLKLIGIVVAGFGVLNLFQFIDKRRKSLEEKKDDTD